MSKHTEGPWWYENNYPDAPEPVDEWVVLYNDGDDSEGGRGYDTIAEVYSEGDARLIAAAPEMLAMLKRLAEFGCLKQDAPCCNRDDNRCSICDDLAALIAKAEGE